LWGRLVRILRIKIENFSSFIDSGWIDLAPNLTVVIGQNNSGKSSLLATINSNIPNKPHRNEKRYLPGDLGSTAILLDIETTTSELRQKIAETNATVRTVVASASAQDISILRNWLNSDEKIILKCKIEGGQNISFREITFRERLGIQTGNIVQISLQNGDWLFQNQGNGRDDTIINAYVSGNAPSFFNFSAQRLNIGRSPFGTEPRLRSDAGNLPGVLAYLMGNHRAQFEEIERRVNEVIPSVGAISVAPENGSFVILLWPDRETRSRELAFSLEDSGTGVAQVIAVITAVVTSASSVVAIDEINSFLHPGAVKKLLQICRTFYPTHQYIISTHSADVISFDGVEKLVLVEREGFVSSTRIVDRENLDEIRPAFKALGVSMMDVMGADRIVWVEGPTEEIVFRDLLQRSGDSVPEGLTFATVASTGDFSKRGSSRKAVIDLYSAATKAVAPLVAGVGFTLDRETLSDDAVEQIERQTDGRLHLLPRRCLECYALQPEVISKLINDTIGEDVTPAEIEEAIKELAQDRAVGGVSRWKGDVYDVDWLRKVDGAEILVRLFSSLTGNRMVFQKTLHTAQILSRVPVSEMGELLDFVKGAVATAMA